MTNRQRYEYVLIELNKAEAPTVLLDDYNYYANKADIAYANSKYNFEGMNQQISDDLGDLVGSTVLSNLTINTATSVNGASVTGTLPRDYFHLLGCIAEFTVKKKYKCYKVGDKIAIGASRLPSGKMSALIDNYYYKPSYKKPYYYIHNEVDNLPTPNPTAPNVPNIQEDQRYAGGREKKIEIRYGKDGSIFQLTSIYLDYLKVPRKTTLTQDEIDADTDTSQVLEFSDYVCMEIIKELVKLLLENASDPRLQTNIPVNQTIAAPGAMQQQRK